MLENSQRMLNQEQQLNALNTQRILQLQESTKERKKKSIFDIHFFRITSAKSLTFI